MTEEEIYAMANKIADIDELYDDDLSSYEKVRATAYIAIKFTQGSYELNHENIKEAINDTTKHLLTNYKDFCK